MIGKVKHGAYLHIVLDNTVSYIEGRGYEVHLTDSAREITEHVQLYKKLEKEGKLEGKTWQEAIPFGSRHLPCYQMPDICRAMDIKVFDKANDRWLTGLEISALLVVAAKIYGFNYGLGTGESFTHLDCRDKIAMWNYSY